MGDWTDFYDEDDVEYSYFSADRLVGVIRVQRINANEKIAQLVELIHLTSRFGAFIRTGEKWEHLWQGWNPDPDYKYINLRDASYQEVVQLFDDCFLDSLPYAEIRKFQTTLNWEGVFDETDGPEHFRDIEEIINWNQDFAEPTPAVITYGVDNVSISDMAWMQPHVDELERLEKETQSYVLAQRSKPSSLVMDESLSSIQMYPPLHQSVLDAVNEAGSHASRADCLEEFEHELSDLPVSHYLSGGRASMRDLNRYFIQMLAIATDYRRPLKQEEVDQLKLFRAKEVKPANRLEVWFLGAEDSTFHNVIANTEFGLFARDGRRVWRPYLRNPEVEDIVELAGCSIVYVRPEREEHLLALADSGKLDSLRLMWDTLNKFRVFYENRGWIASDFADRTPLNQGSELSYADLTRIAAQVVKEAVFAIEMDLKVMKKVGYDVSEMEQSYEELAAFRRNKKNLSYLDLNKLLRHCLEENEYGETLSSVAEDARQAIKRHETLFKLIETREIDYFPTGSLILAFPFTGKNVMWLEYHSKPYGSFVRRSGRWLKGLADYQKEFQKTELYRVTEDSAIDIIALFDEIDLEDHEASIEDVASMIYVPRVLKGKLPEDFDPNSWDASSFTRDEMPPSLASVVEYLYGNVMKEIAQYAESFEDDDGDRAMQVEQWMSRSEGEAMMDFMNRQASISRTSLQDFMAQAQDLLINLQAKN